MKRWSVLKDDFVSIIVHGLRSLSFFNNFTCDHCHREGFAHKWHMVCIFFKNMIGKLYMKSFLTRKLILSFNNGLNYTHKKCIIKNKPFKIVQWIFFKFPVESNITSTQTMNVKTEFDTNYRTIHQAFF